MRPTSFEKRRRIIELLDVRGILAVEAGEKVVYASFALTPSGERGERLKLSNYDQSFEVFWLHGVNQLLGQLVTGSIGRRIAQQRIQDGTNSLFPQFVVVVVIPCF